MKKSGQLKVQLSALDSWVLRPTKTLQSGPIMLILSRENMLTKNVVIVIS